MSNETKITATYADVAYAETYLSELNPRKIVSDTAIEALAENIRQCGLIHPLAGMIDATGKTAIVAGGRRHRALGLLQDDPRFHTVPVHIAPDTATAQAWASAENANREALHPADEIRDYGDMAARGLPVPSIAVAYGVTEKHVYRRLKLASLPAPVIEALRQNEISLSNAAAFTISDDEKRSLEVLAQVRGESYSDQQIKRLLKPDSVTGTDRRALFVGEDAYKAAGGRMGGDLFSDQTYFDDVALLDDLFAQKLAAAADLLKSKGWKWADTTADTYVGYHHIEARKFERIYAERGDLTEAQAERYDELAELAEAEVLDGEGQAELAALQETLDGAFSAAQMALSGVIVYVDHQGHLQGYDGLVLPADKAAALDAGYLRPSYHSPAADTPKSPISAALRDDLDRVMRGARQHAALRNPDLILALLAFQLSGRGGYRGDAFGISTRDVPNWPTTEAEGYALDPRLTTPAKGPKDPLNVDLARSFRAFKGKGMDYVMAELHRHLAALLSAPKGLADLIDKDVITHPREVWTPTAANFFSRVGGPYLNALWRDLLDLAEDHPTATTFAKLKKGEKAVKLEALFSSEDTRKAHRVTEAQAAKIAAWLPEGME